MGRFGGKARLLLVLLGFGSTGCATIFKGSKSCVHVAGMGPRDTAWLAGGSGRLLVPQADGAVEIPLTAGSHVTLGIDGPNGRALARTTKKLGGGWLLLDIFTGFVPLIVDAATGNWMEYDDTGLEQDLPQQGQGVPMVVAPAE